MAPWEIGPVHSGGVKEWIAYHNYEVLVPLEHWVSGASLTPEHTIGRINQMKVYADLFDSNFTVGGEPVVPVPFWKDVAMFWANLIMQYEPELDDTVLDLVSPRFIKMLNVAMKEATADMVTYGTGLLHIYEGRYGAEVVAVKPIYWFPVDDQTSVLLEPDPVPDGDIPMWISSPNGDWEYRRYESGGGVLGDLVETDGGSFGDEASWTAVGENTLGRNGFLINIPLPPHTGNWGRSMFKDITGPCFEILRQYGQNSDALAFHGKPRKIAIPAEGGFPAAGLFGEDSEEGLLNYEDMGDNLADWYSRDVMVLPGGISEWKGDYYEGSLDAAMAQINFSQEMFFAVSKIPEVWYKAGEKGIIPASGVALDFQFRPTYTKTQDFQNIEKTIYISALYSAGLIEGASAADIQRLAEIETILGWRNVFDEEDQRSMVTEGGGEGNEELNEEDPDVGENQ